MIDQFATRVLLGPTNCCEDVREIEPDFEMFYQFSTRLLLAILIIGTFGYNKMLGHEPVMAKYPGNREMLVLILLNIIG